MPDTPYRAVSCQMHSEMELIIMHGQSIEVYSQEQRLIIKPYDIVTRKDSGEFLLAHDQSGDNVEVRLDTIKSWQKVL